MEGKHFFFAGGGTGGHIYPAIAVAERMLKIQSGVKLHFFCSPRYIDSQILHKTSFSYKSLPIQSFSLMPDKFIRFCFSFVESYMIAKRTIAEAETAAVIGIGGFVSVPTCLAARKLRVPIVLLNADVTPGKANKLVARWADKIFVQFEDTRRYFSKNGKKVDAVGCPLRGGFDSYPPEEVIAELGFDRNKKTLLITGASSGSKSINEAIYSLLENLDAFADKWQIVHLTGRTNFDDVRERYYGVRINHKVWDYCDEMPTLLSVVDLVVGRSGAVSVAEYAAAGIPSICIPYPYHKDKHQVMNAGKLVEAGAAVIVDEMPKKGDLGQRLWGVLEELMKDDEKREKMAENCKKVANTQAASKIAEQLLQIS